MDPLFDGVGGFGRVWSIAPAVDGSFDIYIGGSTNRLLRADDDGDIDFVFNVGTGFDGDIYDIAPAADGTGAIYVVGLFNNYDGDPSRKIVRINADGSREVNFMVGKGLDAQPYNIARATNGTTDVYVGGQFSSYDGKDANGIVRLNADGSIDRDFSVSFKAGGGKCTNDNTL